MVGCVGSICGGDGDDIGLSGGCGIVIIDRGIGWCMGLVDS